LNLTEEKIRIVSDVFRSIIES